VYIQKTSLSVAQKMDPTARFLQDKSFIDTAFSRFLERVASMMQSGGGGGSSLLSKLQPLSFQSTRPPATAAAVDGAAQQAQGAATAPSSLLSMRRGTRGDPLVAQLAKRSAALKTAPGGSLAEQHPHPWALRPLSLMSGSGWAAMRQFFGISLICTNRLFSGGSQFHLAIESSPPPWRCWEEGADLLRQPGLLDKLTSRFLLPSPIQMQCLPLALAPCAAAAAGRCDVLGVAETGSGKTLCYVLPAIEHCVRSIAPPPPAVGYDGRPVALIVVPTRELADQVAAVVAEFAPAFLKIAKLVGGEDRDLQYKQLVAGVHLVVGTPGQLNALIDDDSLVLTQARFVAVDEADRMVDESLTEQLIDVLLECPNPRQTLLFTATMLDECAAIATRFLSPQGYFTVRTTYRFAGLEQRFEVFPALRVAVPTTSSKDRESGFSALSPTGVDAARTRRLAALLCLAKPPVIVFVNEKATADGLVEALCRLRRTVEAVEDLLPPSDHAAAQAASTGGGLAMLDGLIAVHADLRQQQRMQFVEGLRRGHHKVLITTDLLARGLDVPGVSLVVNYDMPRHRTKALAAAGDSDSADAQAMTAASDGAANVMRYIHRIGRTARGGQQGVSVSFVLLPEAMLTSVAGSAAGDDDDDGRQAKRSRREGGDQRPAVSDDVATLQPLYKFLLECSGGDERNVFAADDQTAPGDRMKVKAPSVLRQLMGRSGTRK
jgi:superfamily II DNA/RNA helicase